MLWTARQLLRVTGQPLLPSTRQNAERILTVSCSHHQTNKQVGRIEITVALLRQFERLATPHIPRGTIVDVDRSVRQAARIGKHIQKRMLHEGTLALMSPKEAKDLRTTSSADQLELEVRALDNECVDSANYAPMCSAGKLWGSQEAMSIVSRIPSPSAPFCVDISLQAFRSFLDLVKGIRQIMSPVPAPPARNPVGGDKAEFSTAPNGKRTACKAQVATDPIGPESCEEPTTGSPAKVEMFGNQPSKQHATPEANVDGFAVASRSVQMKVLCSTLKLLKVNLFHLVRVAAMRRACRENCVINLTPQIGENPVSNEGHDGNRREIKGADEEGCTGGVEVGSDRLQSSGSRPGDGINNVGRGKRNTPSVSQEILFETSGQKEYSSVRECGEDMHGVIRELHAELRTILEEANADKDPDTTNAALAVQVRSVLFSVCPSNLLTPSLVPHEAPIDGSYPKYPK